MMALADNGDVLVPNVGTASVLRFAALVAARRARRQCPGGIYPRSKVHVSTFVNGLGLPRRGGQGPDVRLLRREQLHRQPRHRLGRRRRASPNPVAARCPARPIAELGKAPSQYNPFGMAFAPDGTLYFVDIHVACKALLTGCGPASYQGRVMKVTLHQRPALDAGRRRGRASTSPPA